MNAQNLLLELQVEELPPKALKKLGLAFSETLAVVLKNQGLAGDNSVVTDFASPRRLAVHLTHVAAQAADKPVSNKLMPVAVGLDAAGQPGPALLKKLASMGLDASIAPQLRIDQATLYFDSVAKGATLAEGLQKALDEAIARLPIPKVMTYQLDDGWSTVNFVRPVHGLLALHGADVVPLSVLGLKAGRSTLGHRFESAGELSIRHADSYEEQLENDGAIIPSFNKRRAEIVRQLKAVADSIGGVESIDDDALLDEVTSLVELPNVLACQFEPAFLEVPQECLILTMKVNQKYFPLLDDQGRLSHHFLLVSNIRPADTSAITGGNERVIRPRLADAKFFFDQDRKKTLASRVEKLGNVVYHNKLGSQLERAHRVTRLAGEIARRLNADAAAAERASHLAKADLLTDMVGEFPELQGIMGRYYATHDGETADVARAIEQHYWPRFAGDVLPQDNIGAASALADKLETLVGIYGIGLIPTGDKDPFGLRRHALGILRILAESRLPLDLMLILTLARSQFTGEGVSESVAQDVYLFMLERLKGYLRDKGYEASEIDAVVSQSPTRIDQVETRLEAVRAFRRLPESASLAAANKRIQNILKKSNAPSGHADPALLQEQAERNLFELLQRMTPQVESQIAREDYAGALAVLSEARETVDAFFDNVMVMADDVSIRNNRLALLHNLGGLMNQVADISKLAA
ncbi:MAG: glycine--tRNA ligase subunit beta [Sulfuricellaceae bacterium]|nr:glycine--tRNA ligase subunit beta [Sulfuricellaceae bacterium]